MEEWDSRRTDGGWGVGLLSFDTLRHRSPNWSRSLHVGEMLYRMVIYKVPTFKGSSYLCTQCIMHWTFNPVCN